ncbi:MAG: hypothetical protein SF052_10325 [Bacteroidia bacterium]|nr:hypothetical protein [Bacteroidia bacterium]
MDPIFVLEFAIVAIIIVMQYRVYSRNGVSIRSLAEIFPQREKLSTFSQVVTDPEEPAGTESQSFFLIEDQENFHPEFRDILHSTNAWLIKTQGSAENESLEQLAERKVDSLEKAIESNIALPLYFGLFCTFSGVIIGLVKIALTGVSDLAIQTFIGGVLIGMVGSASGLALTVKSNSLFREGKKACDRGLYEYFNFLRANMTPVIPRDGWESIRDFRENLSVFNEGFAKYQHHTNESLSETLRLFSEMRSVFEQLRIVQKGLTGMGEYLKANDGLLDKQFLCMDAYAQKAEALTAKLERHHAYVDKELAGLVSEKMRVLEYQTQSAYQDVDYYLNGGHGSNGMSYAEAIDRDLSRLRGDLNQIQNQGYQTNGKLIENLIQEKKTLEEMTDQVREMNTRMAMMQAGQNTHFMNSGTFRTFIFTGIVAFSLGIVGGCIYLVNTLMA